MKLTQKQKRFVQQYLICLNAAEAAKKAGYSEKVSAVIGYENLKKPKIQQAIEETLSNVSSDNVASIQEILEFLTAGLRGELTESVPILTGRGEQQIIQKQIGAKERVRCAELMGKRYGLFKESVSVNGTGTVVIVDDCNQ